MFAQVKYSKYHALGNDYLVITPQDLAFELTPEKIGRGTLQRSFRRKYYCCRPNLYLLCSDDW
jgi:hypothetical protein